MAVCLISTSYSVAGIKQNLVRITSGNNLAVKTIAGALPYGELSRVSCTGRGSTAICTAVGYDLTRLQSPLLALSSDGGMTWETKTIKGALFNGQLNGVSCIGSGSTAFCTAVGYGFSDYTSPPLLTVSADGGTTWGIKTIPGAPEEGSFYGVSCTGTGVTAICTGVGQEGSLGVESPPLLAVSSDGGTTWRFKTIPGVSTSAGFNAVSCTGNGATAICTAVGHTVIRSDEDPDGDYYDINLPLLVVSSDGGSHWTVKNIPGAPTEGDIRSVSCIGSGVTAICTAVGDDLLVVSADGGTTWGTKTITGALHGKFTEVTCTGHGATAICTAVSGSLIAVSTDGGNNWAAKTLNGAPNANFLGASCAGSGVTAICMAVGDNAVAMSADGGETWGVKTITGSSTQLRFEGVSCTGRETTAVCTAVGNGYSTTPTPLVVVSADAGNNWAVKTISGL